VANYYDPKLPVQGEELLVQMLNQAISDTVAAFPSVKLVDVYSAFKDRSGLLLIEKKDAGFQSHPTNAGHRVIADAFAAALK
jgi:hypothetical protein